MQSEPSTEPVVIREYDRDWPEFAAAIAGEILAACSGLVAYVEHIGSTSIPGCAAKPVIDLMPALTDAAAGAACAEPLTKLGYEYRGEYGIPQRHYFVRPADFTVPAPPVHLHAYVPETGQWQDHLDFRDYLRTHDDARDEYVELKRRLARHFGVDRGRYSEAKGPFVRRVIERARSNPR